MTASVLSLPEAVKTLEGLSPREIATLLAEYGIHGRAGTPCSCPLAIYFQSLTGEDVNVAYLTCWIGFGSGVRLPAGAQRFVTEFDGGSFPELRVA